MSFKQKLSSYFQFLQSLNNPTDVLVGSEITVEVIDGEILTVETNAGANFIAKYLDITSNCDELRLVCVPVPDTEDEDGTVVQVNSALLLFSR